MWCSLTLPCLCLYLSAFRSLLTTYMPPRNCFGINLMSSKVHLHLFQPQVDQQHTIQVLVLNRQVNHPAVLRQHAVGRRQYLGPVAHIVWECWKGKVQQQRCACHHPGLAKTHANSRGARTALARCNGVQNSSPRCKQGAQSAEDVAVLQSLVSPPTCKGQALAMPCNCLAIIEQATQSKQNRQWHQHEGLLHLQVVVKLAC